MSEAVDFNAIKEQINMEHILNHYDLLHDMHKSDRGLRGQCPFHDDADPSFTTTPSGRGFHCFGCDAKGNVISFVRLMEGMTAGDIEENDRDAARLIQTWFGIEPIPRQTAAPASPQSAPAPDPPEPKENPPLPFTLDSLDHHHPYLVSRGLSPATIKHFGIGYFPRQGSMKGRIVIPIHNPQGQLVAYAGRWPAETPPEGALRYKLPRGFHKSLELYNLHRVSMHARTVILVEGFWPVFHLYQCGFRNVVALMGASISESQRQLLCDRFQSVQVFLDGDKTGREARVTVAGQLAPHLWIKTPLCPEGQQPDQLTLEQLRQLLR